MKLKAATRFSALALAQTRQVLERLKAFHPSWEAECLPVTTTGDRFPDKLPLELSAHGGTRGVFVKELEGTLLRCEADFAVHSLKDLPSELPPGLTLACIPPREEPWDVLVAAPRRTAGHSAEQGAGLADSSFSDRTVSVADLPPGAKVATGSLRRQFQMRMLRPDLRFVPVRGNLDTRLKKWREGQYGALVCAQAGLKRLGQWTGNFFVFSAQEMVPAPGQGALAVEIREDRRDLMEIFAPMGDAAAATEAAAERSFLKAMGGGCSVPLGALARLQEGRLCLHVFWSDSEGNRPIRLSETSSACEAESLGVRLAARVRQVAGEGKAEAA